jgi:hypothetical protein
VGIIINENYQAPTSFQTKVYIVKVPLTAKIVKKDLLHGKIYEVKSKKGDFIDYDPLEISIDAVVVLFLFFSLLFL